MFEFCIVSWWQRSLNCEGATYVGLPLPCLSCVRIIVNASKLFHFNFLFFSWCGRILLITMILHVTLSIYCSLPLVTSPPIINPNIWMHLGPSILHFQIWHIRTKIFGWLGLKYMPLPMVWAEVHAFTYGSSPRFKSLIWILVCLQDL